MKKIFDYLLGGAFGAVIVLALANAARLYTDPDEPNMTLACVVSYAFGAITLGAALRLKEGEFTKYNFMAGLTLVVGILWLLAAFFRVGYGWVTIGLIRGQWWIIGLLSGIILSGCANAISKRWQRRAMSTSLLLAIFTLVYILSGSASLPGYSGAEPYLLFILAAFGIDLWSPPEWLYAAIRKKTQRLPFQV